MTTMTSTLTQNRDTSTVHRVLVALLAVVLLTDVVGGLVDVWAGRSTLGSAWGSHATLAAPLPMIVAQAVMVVLVLRAGRRTALGAAALLALACGVSFVSGFVDGQLGRGDLSAGEVGFQVWLISATLVLGVAAAVAGRLRWTSCTPSPTSVPSGGSPSGSPC